MSAFQERYYAKIYRLRIVEQKRFSVKGVKFTEELKRFHQLADERSLTFFKLSQICDVSHSTLKKSERRGGQLSVDTIERICDGLGITMSEFFARKG